MDIALSNQQSAVAIDESRIVAAVRQIMADAELEAGSLSVALVDDATIHRLNVRHLQHDYPTDVLSFVLEDSPGRLVGEIIVSGETAFACAAEYDQSPADELLLYIIHGALHLVGYNDKSASEADAMRAAEARYLQQFGGDAVPISSPVGERIT